MRDRLVRSSRPLVFLLLAAAVVLFMMTRAVQSQGSGQFDVLIRHGRVVDGTGAPWQQLDVGVRGDRIAALGRLDDASAEREIDATGLVVSPGFIDLLGQSEFFLLVDNRAASKVYQGVTTEITGEGSSIAPLNDVMVEAARPLYDHYKLTIDFRTLGEYFQRLSTRTHPAINVGSFVGAGSVRDFVIGKENRPATAQELERMQALVSDAMAQGALGLSTSLQYVPDRFASTDELVALASVAARAGGVYFTHQRSESGQIMQSLEEVAAIAERAHIPAEIWHLKTAYRANWGRMPEVLHFLEGARARGLDVTANMYPYTRASNGLDACLPIWVREGGIEKMIARLGDPAIRERARNDMADPQSAGWENQWYGSGGGDGVMVASVLNPDLRQYEGMTLTAIGKKMGKDPRDAVMDLVVADRGQTSCILSMMDEADVRTALAHPLIAIGTDSEGRAEDGPLAGTSSHPRGWGSFPRFLGHYVRDEHLVPLEEAVRRVTSRPAARVGLTDRGALKVGLAADITIFDPATIRDVATFESPNHYSVGVKYVFVNGRAVLADGRMTTERPGQVLRGPGYRP
jgi:dihydroorotase/N-acyl-D-amino-acid deacylase